MIFLGQFRNNFGDRISIIFWWISLWPFLELIWWTTSRGISGSIPLSILNLEGNFLNILGISVLISLWKISGTFSWLFCGNFKGNFGYNFCVQFQVKFRVKCHGHFRELFVKQLSGQSPILKTKKLVILCTDYCWFHSIFHFGQRSYENMKILRNLLSILQSKTGKKNKQTETHRKENHPRGLSQITFALTELSLAGMLGVL